MPLNSDMKLVVMPPHAFFPRLLLPQLCIFYFTKLSRSFFFAFKTPVSQYIDLPTFIIYTIKDHAPFLQHVFCKA